MKLGVLLGLAAALLMSPLAARAAGAEGAAPDFSWVDELDRGTGVIALPTAEVRLNLGENFYFLDAADSQKVLVDGWGNPPESTSDVLGMVFPAGVGPLDQGAWGAVVTFEGDGYVSDKDAHKIDYDGLLKNMQKGAADSNKLRQEEGYPTVDIVGWAEAPTYDASRHVLIWARELKFNGEEANTLNYDIRVLGRRGVLSLNVVAGMEDLEAVRAASASFASTANFQDGARYADFVAGEDKTAAYGLAGLIGAGAVGAVAKKAGLLAVLAIFFKKAGVFILIGLAAAGRWPLGIFKRKGGSA